MLPIAPLMIEHRLIEKMVGHLTLELKRLKNGGRIDCALNRVAVDFFRVYADQTHHGKEESILFRELEKKELSLKHRETMENLIKEHIEARRRVQDLLAAKTEEEAIACLEYLVDLYPRHIAVEDKDFFIPVMTYFSEAEKEDMLRAGREFDEQMIHNKYKAIVEELEKRFTN